jgi:hypothetical protein
MSIMKTITLKFADGRRESALILAETERGAQRQISQLMTRKGAYGFSTQSTVVRSGR